MIHYYSWFFDDWFLSESRLFMTLEERGLYRELLDRCYRDGSIPANEETLRRMSAATDEEFGRAWPKVRERFQERDGRLHNERVDFERQQILDATEQRKEAARKRWASNGKRKPYADAMRADMRTHMRADMQPQCYPEQEHKPDTPNGVRAREGIVHNFSSTVEIDGRAKDAVAENQKPEPEDPDPPGKRAAPERKPANPERARAIHANTRAARPPGGDMVRFRTERIVDMRPHAPEAVQFVRALLAELAALVKRPEPDDGIVRQVLDAARGAPTRDVQAVVSRLYRERRFRDMRSWGLLPVLVAPWFKISARAG